MADDDIQVPVDLPVSGTSAPETSEPLAQPDKAAPSTGTEQTAEETAPAEEAKAETPEAEPAEEQPPEPKRSPWFVERLAKQREQIAERDRRIQETEARLAALERGQQTDPNQPTQPSHQDLAKWADQMAEQKLQVRLFNDNCNKVADKGETEFKDFRQSTAVLNAMGALRQEVLNPLFDTCEDLNIPAHKVLYNLGKSPEDAERILGLLPHPHRLGAALVRFAEKSTEPKPAPPVSTAPKPVKPISGAAKVSDPSNMSESEWYRNWLKQQGAQP